MDLDGARRLAQRLLDPEVDWEPPRLAEGPSIDVPGYRVERRIGTGASGNVWLAYSTHSERPVALKVFRQKLADRRHAQRAWRELALVADIRLPCVPRLLDYGVQDGRVYIATEYVSGEQLDSFVAQQGLDLRDRVELLERLSRAVAELHTRGVIHRDLKPSNVLVTSAGDPVIVDFGTAALLDRGLQETLTAEGDSIGTPAFMAPEQARGDRATISTRSDVYAIGAICYLLLAGDTPYDLNGASLCEALRRVGSEEPRMPAFISPGLPRSLGAVLRKACASDPTRRYLSATDLADDLGRWRRSEPVQAGDLTLWQRMARWAGRHPLWTTSALGTVIVALTIMLSLGITWFTLGKPASATRSAEGRRITLLSLSGQPVRLWTIPASSPGQYTSAEPLSLPGHREFMLAVSGQDVGEGPIDDAIGVFRGGDPQRPLWTLSHAQAALVIPQDILDLQRSPYREQLEDSAMTQPYSAILRAADVFPSVPGDELVVIYRHAELSPTCIRVLAGLDGQVLFEVWHDGAIDDSVWVPRQSHLVAWGPANSLWRDTGYSAHPTNATPYPKCCFALQPVLGTRIRGSVSSPDSGRPGSTVWMKAFATTRYSQYVVRQRVAAVGQGRPGSYAVLRLALQAHGQAPTAGLDVFLGADGSSHALTPSDTWSGALPGIERPASSADLGLVDVTGYDPANSRLGDWVPDN